MRRLKVIADGRVTRNQSEIDVILESKNRLSSDEPEVRKVTLRGLIENPDQRTWLKLFWLMIADEDQSMDGVRELAKEALERLGPPNKEQLRYAIEEFDKECKREVKDVRTWVIEAFVKKFAEINAVEAIPTLLKVLGHFPINSASQINMLNMKNQVRIAENDAEWKNILINIIIHAALIKLGAPSKETMLEILKVLTYINSLNINTLQTSALIENGERVNLANGFKVLFPEHSSFLNIYLLNTNSSWAFIALLTLKLLKQDDYGRILPFNSLAEVDDQLAKMPNPSDPAVLMVLHDILTHGFGDYDTMIDCDKRLIEFLSSKGLLTFDLIKDRLKNNQRDVFEWGNNTKLLINKYTDSVVNQTSAEYTQQEALKWLTRMFGTDPFHITLYQSWLGHDFYSFRFLPEELKTWITTSLKGNQEAKETLRDFINKDLYKTVVAKQDAVKLSNAIATLR